MRWDTAGNATELGVLGTSIEGTTLFDVAAINDAGTVVGYVNKYVSHVWQGRRAVRWDASKTSATELGNLGTFSSGSTTCEALAINNLGAIVGSASKFDAAHAFMGSRAVRWDASSSAATELGNLGTAADGKTTCEARSLNDTGLIVGQALKYDALGNNLGNVAALWKPDTLAVDLNSLIDPSSGWTLTSAYDINNFGWITGSGTFDPDGAGGQAAYERLWLLHYIIWPPGDLNGDGQVTLSDINPFKLALSAWDAYVAQFPGIDHLFVADTNGDSRLTLSDINSFKSLLTGGSAAAIPEPAAISSLVLAIVGLLARPPRRDRRS
ncbi:MAG: DUF3466 family protein [Phycisphaeraceae bacterium]|nr:DUF3466 family protein [Phycisphaeraceae bacterium]